MVSETFQETIDQYQFYRPLSKVMERILYDQLYSYLTKSEVLSNSQKFHSKVTA